MSDVTRILNAIERGDAQATDELLPLVYEELRLLAAQKLSHEAPGQTLQATALVHEAYLRLVGDEPQSWQNCGHFFAAAAEAMRLILVENARRKRSAKHGGDRRRLDLIAVDPAADGPSEDVLVLDEAIEKLAQDDPEVAKLVKLRLLGGPITGASWVPDGTKLVFHVGPPYREIWVADLDRGVSAIESLGPGRTPQEHLREMVALCTRRIAADPLDAHAYYDRARYYDDLRERTEADADMKRWCTAMSGRSPSDSWFGTPCSLRRVIGMPFDCELVFSAERPVNRTPIMSVAFGQKGRCAMKLFELPLLTTSLLGLVLLSGFEAPPAQANFTFGQATNLGPAINTGAEDGGVCISPDGLELYLYSFTDGFAIPTFRVSKRATTDDSWRVAVSLAPPFKRITSSCISADGLSLYFEPEIQSGDADIWMATRASVAEPWVNPVNLGPSVNSPYLEMGPSITADGLELYFGSARPGGSGGWDIWVSTRAKVSDPWSKAVNLDPTLNCPADDVHPFVTPDGLVLFITSTRPGGYGDWDIWMTRRATRDGAWGTLVNLGPSLNTPAGEAEPYISADGQTLYFSDWWVPRPGGMGKNDLWQAPIIPVVDFNGDGKVDLVDLVMLIDNWGKSNTLCDIGPYAWGDGKVDIEDLKVFMTYYEKENPPVQP